MPDGSALAIRGGRRPEIPVAVGNHPVPVPRRVGELRSGHRRRRPAGSAGAVGWGLPADRQVGGLRDVYVHGGGGVAVAAAACGDRAVRAADRERGAPCGQGSVPPESEGEGAPDRVPSLPAAPACAAFA